MALKIDELTGTTKKELHIFYVLDTSGSMMGEPIGALNDAMRSTVNELRKKDGEKADFKIGVLEYNSKIRWITAGNNGIENLQDFFWKDLDASGLTYLGAALEDLNKSLSRNDKMKASTGNKVPVVIFMSDGYPNDDWEPALAKLAQNKWYQQAIKVAFALGDNADAEILAKVVGVQKGGSIVSAPGAVLKTNDLEIFSKMIQAVSVTASLASSRSRLEDDDLSGEKILKEAEGKKPDDTWFEMGKRPGENGPDYIDIYNIDGVNLDDEGFGDIDEILV